MRVPQLMRDRMSSVLVSSVGMFGRGASWALTLPNFPLNVAVGGIVERPCLAGGQLENREMLCITVSFDHDIIDGAPAARFGQRFRELLESAELLDPDPGQPTPLAAGG
jgi:pyruvate/2-oxoglutarate dehydrogenase complex dihydrolipoamide acyltransferase (E2) component